MKAYFAYDIVSIDSSGTEKVKKNERNIEREKRPQQKTSNKSNYAMVNQWHCNRLSDKTYASTSKTLLLYEYRFVVVVIDQIQ